jgi:hypothetical protein
MADDMAVTTRGSAVAAPDRVSDPTLRDDAAAFQRAARTDASRADTGWDASPRGAPPKARNNGANARSQTSGAQRSSPPSGPRVLNDGTGSRFNWRDYITVKHNTAFLDEKGQPTDRLRQLPVEYQDRIRAEALRNRENEQITERTLDQLSLIPEFRDSIKKAHAIFSAKVAADPELAKESGGKLRVSLSDAELGFKSGTGTMYLNVRDVASTRYMTADGPKPFSLQRVLVHELAGHGPDGSITPEKDLNQRKEALTRALDGVFRYYPELDLKAEYERSHTILGKPVGDLFSAPDSDTFDRNYKNLLDTVERARRIVPREDLDKLVIRKYPPDERDFEVLNAALNSLYKAELDDIIETQDEKPAIEIENRIMKRYYGEKHDRIRYAADQEVGKREPFALPPSLADLTYPGIRMNPSKLAPRRGHSNPR